MKIRLDFVTNSSSSSFTCVEGYDSETKPDVTFPYYEPPVYYVEEIDISEEEAKDWEYKKYITCY